MKFMPQDMFEVMAISMAKYKLLGDEEFLNFKFAMHEAYKNDFKGDVLWHSQAEEMIPDIHQLVTKIKAKDFFKYLTVASEFRQKLDENLEIPSAAKKIFGGSLFTHSHPSPSSRKEIALKNIARLMVMMAANGYVHD